MDSVQLLAGQVASIDRRTERMERKIDQYIPLASRVPGIESRMDSVDRKADEFLKAKWQMVGAVAVIAFLVQMAVAYLK